MNAFQAYRKEFLVDVYSVKAETISVSKKQAVKKHIERMNITGENEYRNEVYKDAKKVHRYSKMIAKQNTEKLTTLLNKKLNEDEMAISLESKSILENEPVYAVIDLKSKYMQRKKRLMATQGKRWHSYESIFPSLKEQQEQNDQHTEAIYEDGDAYYLKQVDDRDLPIVSSKVEEENIYEPINIGEHTGAFTLGKYIARLTLNPLLRLKSSKTLSKNSKTSISLNESNSKKTHFSTIRSKFGFHRKSIQRRIRKLYGNSYEPSPLFQYPSEDVSAVNTITIANDSDCGQVENINSNQNEKTNTFESLPQFKRAIARITLLQNSPFKNTIRQKTNKTKNHNL